MISKTLCIGVLLLPLVGCGPETASDLRQLPSDPQVLAVYAEGNVTATDLDKAILRLPPNLRKPQQDQSVVEWQQELIRELVIDRLLDAERDLLGDTRAVSLAQKEARRSAMVDLYLERNPPGSAEVTPAEARRYFQQHPELYQREGSRLVSHLFKRLQDGQSVDLLKAEVEALRANIVSGASFASVAAEFSESESRHQQGNLGWMRRDQLAPQLADVIFSLAEGIPSQPLVTPEGVHLFQVGQSVKAKAFTFEEVEGNIYQRLQQQRARASIAQLAEKLELPPGSFLVEDEELGPLLGAGDEGAIVLRTGDYELTTGRLRSMINQNQTREPVARQTTPLATAREILVQLERRERIRHRAELDGLDQDPRAVERLAHLDRVVALRSQRQEQLQRFLDRNPERLEAYYDNNKARFSSPLELELRRLTVPTNARSANRVMTALENLANESSGTGDRLESSAEEFGGEIEVLGSMTLRQVANFNPRWVQVVARMMPGSLSPPISREGGIDVLEVTARREPRPLPLADVHEQVRLALVADNSQRLYRDWSSEALDEAGFEVFPERLAILAGGAPVEPGQTEK